MAPGLTGPDLAVVQSSPSWNQGPVRGAGSPSGPARAGCARGAAGRAGVGAARSAARSGIPTQIVVGQALTLAGWPPFSPDGTPRLTPLFALALADTVLVLLVITLLLRAGGERLRPLLLGRRAPGREAGRDPARAGALHRVGVTVLVVRRLLPWSHNVPLNPLGGAPARRRRDAGLFAVVALDRRRTCARKCSAAFLLHRASSSTSAARRVGPAICVESWPSVRGHAHAGAGTPRSPPALLGLHVGSGSTSRRRSAVAPIVSHAGLQRARRSSRRLPWRGCGPDGGVERAARVRHLETEMARRAAAALRLAARGHPAHLRVRRGAVLRRYLRSLVVRSRRLVRQPGPRTSTTPASRAPRASTRPSCERHHRSRPADQLRAQSAARSSGRLSTA